MKQADIVRAIDRQPAWVSRNLRGPGNWTLRTIGEMAEALGGELEIIVHAKEDSPEKPNNYSAYAGYERLGSDAAALQGGGQVTGVAMPAGVSAGQVIG